jgi:hypothetical protein
MGFLSGLIGTASMGTVKGAMEGIGSLAQDIRSAITGDISPEKQAELLSKATEIEAKAKQGQLEINKVEAAHRSVFVAGWRPGLGWVVVTCIALYFIPQYLMATVLWVKVCWNSQVIAPFPIGEPKGLVELISGMLGLGILRTVEKIKDKTV